MTIFKRVYKTASNGESQQSHSPMPESALPLGLAAAIKRSANYHAQRSGVELLMKKGRNVVSLLLVRTYRARYWTCSDRCLRFVAC